MSGMFRSMGLVVMLESIRLWPRNMVAAALIRFSGIYGIDSQFSELQFEGIVHICIWPRGSDLCCFQFHAILVRVFLRVCSVLWSMMCNSRLYPRLSADAYHKMTSIGKTCGMQKGWMHCFGYPFPSFNSLA